MRKVKFALTLVLLAAFVAMLAGEALAYPDWITVSAPKELSLVKNGKDINKGDYWAVEFTVTYANKKDSKRIITAIFDKTLSVKGLKPNTNKYHVDWKVLGAATITSSKINKDLEVWPNSSKRLYYYIPLDKVLSRGVGSSSWPTINSFFENNKTPFVYDSWSHDFQVRSEKM